MNMVNSGANGLQTCGRKGKKTPAALSGGKVTNIRKNRFVGEYHLR